VRAAAREPGARAGPEARRRGLLWREELDAVLVGAGTVTADDPLLYRRLGVNRESPHARIVLDGGLIAPERARIFRRPEGVIVATAEPVTHPKARRLARRGVIVWSLPGRRRGEVDLRRLLSELLFGGVTSLLVEGGGATHAAFVREGLVDRVAVFLAPRVLGGDGVPSVGPAGLRLGNAPRLSEVEVERLGEDVLVTGRL